MTRAIVKLILTACAVGVLVWVLYLPGALTPAMGEDNGPQLIPAVSIVAPTTTAPAPVAGTPEVTG